MMFQKYKKYILVATLGGLGSLGFVRGTNHYEYCYNKKLYQYYCYEDRKYKNPPYLYSTRTVYGLFGTFCYITPFMYCVVLPKEVFRLEVNLRGLDSVKTESYYNLLL
jgi:hypothetical protein